MRKAKERSARFDGNGIYRIVIGAFVLICLLIGIACFQYYDQLQKTLKAESGGYLHEISKQIGVNATKTIDDNFSILGTIATVLQNAGVTSYQEIQPVAQEQQRYWNYQSILLIDEGGTAYDAYGKTVLLESDTYLRQAVVEKRPSMSASQVVNGRECIVFALPLEELTIDGQRMVALAATYDLGTFDRILAMTAFDGQGYAHVIRPDGAVVVRSSSENAASTGYNLLNSLAQSDFRDGSMETVRADIAAGRSGQAEIDWNGSHDYMGYTPLDTQGWYLFTFVPVSVVNAKSELLVKITLLLCGFITLAFAALTGFMALSFYRHKRKLEQIAYLDPITGGNTIQRFYQLAQAALDLPNRPRYALVYANIEKFKVLNEQYGRAACDEVLREIAHGISDALVGHECMGRQFADIFCALVEYESEKALAARFGVWRNTAVNYAKEHELTWLPLVMEFGVYLVDDASVPFPDMIDRAKLALRESTRDLGGKLRYAVYDEAVRRRLRREKELEDHMEAALEERQFQVYFQAKYRTQDETIGGAEALVRWLDPVEGMIYPDEFIPLFEKNGFIVPLDLWVFEETCRTLRTWLDAGLKPVRVSVNCSRMHLKTPRFLEEYQAIASRYAIPGALLEIELTEGMVFGDVDHLTQTIREIHDAGFQCSMDDFGSGYSSLNLIKDIPVDVLKLDRVFFLDSARDLPRTESVVGSIIAMARALKMETVAEGVEEAHQVAMLQRLGCDLIQGYYFAKPMPIADFETLAFGAPVDCPAST